MQKTYAEIIDETLAAGYTLTNRGIEGGTCRYLSGTNGVPCAIGRCCEAPQADWYGPWTGLRVTERATVLEPCEREALLKPEYRGKSSFFWMELQGLHDDDDNWTEFGISEDGLRFAEYLKGRWHDSTN